MSNTNERKKVVSEEDIYIYERLGFTPDPIDAFYTNDITNFYRDKIDGKSKSTERKYRNSLYDIREILEVRHIKSWAECDEQFWKRLLTKDIYDLFGGTQYVSNTQYKELLTTVKAFVKWLSREGELDLEKELLTIIGECEDKRKLLESRMKMVESLEKMKKIV